MLKKKSFGYGLILIKKLIKIRKTVNAFLCFKYLRRRCIWLYIGCRNTRSHNWNYVESQWIMNARNMNSYIRNRVLTSYKCKTIRSADERYSTVWSARSKNTCNYRTIRNIVALSAKVVISTRLDTRSQQFILILDLARAARKHVVSFVVSFVSPVTLGLFLKGS